MVITIFDDTSVARIAMKTLSNLKLDGGCPVFDFTNTISNRNIPFFHDYLDSYEAFLEWAKKSGLLPTMEIKQVMAYANANPKKSSEKYKEVLEVRDTLFELFSQFVIGRKPNEDVLTKFNAMLSCTLSHVKIKMVGHEIQTSLFDSDLLLDVPIFLLVKNAFDILTHTDPSRIKECPTCGWLFLDKTKNGKRRWCNMQVCGARDKSHRYYERQKTAET